MCILIHLGEMLYTLKGYILSNQIKNVTVTNVRLVPNVFFMVVVVVTTGQVGVVFRLSFYFRSISEMDIICVECLWSDPNNVKL